MGLLLCFNLKHKRTVIILQKSVDKIEHLFYSTFRTNVPYEGDYYE
jgi:hypothetical protein